MIVSQGCFLSRQEEFKYQIVMKFVCGEINRSEASQLMQTSERSVSRLASKVRAKGVFGVKHGNVGRSPKHRIEDGTREFVIKLLCEKYFDFNLKHFYEILVSEYDVRISYKTLWSWCRERKLIKNPRVRRRKKREYRHRMPQEGLLLQMDGSHHKFNGKDEWCLIAAIDDATSKIPYAEFFEGETTQGCMAVLKRIIELYGVPKAIYTDRAGWSGGGKRVNFSQFKRACDELGIQLIFANSPEGKGRIERSFRTIQDRLIPELRLHGITEMAQANQYLQEQFLKNYWNKANVVVAQNPQPAYTPLNPFIDLNLVLCIEETRKINWDQTISWQGEKYKIVDGPFIYGNYEAVIKTMLSGEQRVFIRDHEVKIERIEEPQPTPASPSEKIVLDRALYWEMCLLVDQVRSAVRAHQVTGKPLNLRPRKTA